MTHTYDIYFFIEHFGSIPEDKWCTGKFLDSQNRMCARGFVSIINTDNIGFQHIDSIELTYRLSEIISSGTITMVNDGHHGMYKHILSIIERVVTALKDIKDGKLDGKTGFPITPSIHESDPKSIRDGGHLIQ